eukprot:CAMPEP_0197548102 /NCGR_PEP_ID=MMETSP1320-20131121/2308_1 /TAXON_ID=91990 /ORGANISM="Bolidomonas sp., Strain RCC2347" /LENGTH=64 /DNA_ID=CAMNT_0043108041 /DNA_START=6 /DNA_END=197 /DNA_ORIENTATION=+
MPHLQVPDCTIEVVFHAIPVGSADDVVGAGQDIGLVSVSLGADQDAILVRLHGGILDGYHHMGP